MLEIIIHWTFFTLFHNMLFTYFYLKQVVAFLLFYPIGIPLTLSIMALITYCLIKAAIIIVTVSREIYYNWWDILWILDQLRFFFKITLTPFNFIYRWLLEILSTYSVYYYIFYFKRIEIHIFWFMCIIFYC